MLTYSQVRPLPLTNAPVEVRSIIRTFETSFQDFDLPTVTSAATFSPVWWKWWLSFQPVWRLNPEAKAGTPPKLKTAISAGDSLKELCYGGKMGLTTVVFGLALWANAVEHSQPSNKSLAAAVTDVSWVLKTLVGDEHSSTTAINPGKRPSEVVSLRAKKK